MAYFLVKVITFLSWLLSLIRISNALLVSPGAHSLYFLPNSAMTREQFCPSSTMKCQYLFSIFLYAYAIYYAHLFNIDGGHMPSFWCSASDQFVAIVSYLFIDALISDCLLCWSYTVAQSESPTAHDVVNWKTGPHQNKLCIINFLLWRESGTCKGYICTHNIMVVVYLGTFTEFLLNFVILKKNTRFQIWSYHFFSENRL